ncbi:hypothetical protein M8C21_023806 [Ambrosia artemisiifolia]|uniref:Uncharacterized protein n=1 Tax=Ambrosia artemisiifolia TaxID=4212 RepID=A0AAD5BST3_AMBAR|nr:hypothetical protein M8C21_023806 [Ambrosia artemisiifolia]
MDTEPLGTVAAASSAASEPTGTSIDATLFDKLTNQLLNKTCDLVLEMSNPYDAFQEIENQDAQFHVQIQKDKETRCTVSKVYVLNKEQETGSSTPSEPSTPAPKARDTASIKRSMMSPDDEATVDKRKRHKTE